MSDITQLSDDELRQMALRQIPDDQLQSMGGQKQEPSFWSQVGQGIMEGVRRGVPAGPMGIAVGVAHEVGKPFTEQYNKFAYNAGGAATDLAAKTGLSPEVSGGLGYAANVGIQALPVIAGSMIGREASPVLQNTGRGLMQSAVKPTLSQHESGQAEKGIEALLQQGYNPTESGVRAMGMKVGDLNKAIADEISQSSATVDKAAVGSRLNQTAAQFSKQVNPEADLNAVNKAWIGFRDHPDLANKIDFPVQLAQELKKGTYKQLAGKYGELGSADVEAQKALARGLREEISNAVPGVEQLNKKESELLAALQIAQRRAFMEGNKNPAGLSLLAENPRAAMGFMADKSALFKSLLARMLYSGSKVIPETAAGLGVAGYEAANQYTGGH